MAEQSFFKSKKFRNIMLLVIIAVASITVRTLMEIRIDRTALLYVGVPTLIAMALLAVELPDSKKNWKYTYLNVAIKSLIVMLVSSALLYEGFICVVMFMPIYFAVLLVVFIIHALINFFENKKNHQGKNYVQILPVLLLLSAFEGVFPQFSFEREYEVTIDKVIHASVDDIKAKMATPFDLDVPRHWMLELFPMPYEIDAGSLNAGDIHTISFRYHRWFVTNTHEGDMKLQITDVNNEFVKARFIKDESYISNYLIMRGTEVHFKPLDENKTHVSLKIKYHRFLDPVWYFGPLLEFAMKHTGELFYSQIIAPDGVVVEAR